MNAPDKNGIVQKDLDPDEQTIVAELEKWLEANPRAQWKQVEDFKFIEQCPEENLRKILKRLAKKFGVATFRTRHSGWGLAVGNGELISISPSEGCEVSVEEGVEEGVEEQTYPLLGGTKLCISKKVHMKLAGGDVLYLVWKQGIPGERIS